MPGRSFLGPLQTLANHRVEFIVVDGVAEVLLGVPYNTFDLDLVHSREPANIARLLGALAELDAVYRYRREFRPDASHLLSAGHQLLHTRFGSLDLLGSIGDRRDYADLFKHSPEMALGPALTVRVLDLETQIVIKEQLAGDKDKLILPLLRRTLEESRKA